MAYLSIHCADKIYSQGQKLTGTVSLETKHDIKDCKSIIITLSGKEYIKWKEFPEGTSQDSIGTVSGIVYEHERKIFEASSTLWVSKDFATISKGEYQYSFEIDIPDELMPSTSKDIYSEVSYKLYCILEKKKEDKEYGDLENLLEIKNDANVISPEILIKISGCQVDQSFLDWNQRNNKIIKSVDIKEYAVIGASIMTMTCAINRDTFFGGEKLAMELVICNGTKQVKVDKINIELIKQYEYIYDKRSMIGRITKYKERKERIIHNIVEKIIKPNQRDEVYQEIEIPDKIQESTLGRDNIIRISYSLRISIPNIKDIIEIPLYLIDPLGCQKRRQIVNLQKPQKTKTEIIDEEFEFVEDNIGFLDQEPKDEKVEEETITLEEYLEESKLKNLPRDKSIEEISKLLDD